MTPATNLKGLWEGNWESDRMGSGFFTLEISSEPPRYNGRATWWGKQRWWTRVRGHFWSPFGGHVEADKLVHRIDQVEWIELELLGRQGALVLSGRYYTDGDSGRVLVRKRGG